MTKITGTMSIKDYSNNVYTYEPISGYEHTAWGSTMIIHKVGNYWQATDKTTGLKVSKSFNTIKK